MYVGPFAAKSIRDTSMQLSLFSVLPCRNETIRFLKVHLVVNLKRGTIGRPKGRVLAQVEGGCRGSRHEYFFEPTRG